MSLNEDLLLDLIGGFYDAALAPAEWPRALERLSDVLGGVPVHFGVQRLPQGMPWMASGSGAVHFTADEVAFLQRLLPHLNRCLQVQLRLETAEAESRELAAALDRLPLAVILLGAQAQVVRANAAAEALLSAGDGLTVRCGRLVASDSRAAERLRSLIAAAATGAGRGVDPGGHMALPRRPPSRPLSIFVSPLPEGLMRDRGIRAAALMLIRDPDRQRHVSEEHLKGALRPHGCRSTHREGLAHG
jgi:hypothetical protein